MPKAPMYKNGPCFRSIGQIRRPGQVTIIEPKTVTQAGNYGPYLYLRVGVTLSDSHHPPRCLRVCCEPFRATGNHWMLPGNDLVCGRPPSSLLESREIGAERCSGGWIEVTRPNSGSAWLVASCHYDRETSNIFALTMSMILGGTLSPMISAIQGSGTRSPSGLKSYSYSAMVWSTSASYMESTRFCSG